MKLYKTQVQTGADSFTTYWSGSQADASKTRTAMKQKAGIDPNSGKPAIPTTKEIDIPTNKVSLLEFLNRGGLV